MHMACGFYYAVNPVAIILTVSASDVDEGQSITVCGEVALSGIISNISTSFPIVLTFLEQDGVASGKHSVLHISNVESAYLTDLR